jgi:hypothetical protein
VDVIRRVKNRYMCTARAEIPFKVESLATDDFGLHKIAYTYEYIPLASAVVVSQRAELAAWLLASSPINPTIGDYLFRREILLRTVSAQKSGSNVIKGSVPVAAFEAELRKFASAEIEKFVTAMDTKLEPIRKELEDINNRLKKASDLSAAERQQLNERKKELDAKVAVREMFAGGAVPKLDQLRAMAAHVAPDEFATRVLKRFEFKNDGGAEVFDLDRVLPELNRKDPITGAQASYELVLNVRVTDSNVLSEAERSAENEASLLFKVVPEHELFAEISREEGELARKFDDVIKRIEGAQRNLIASASRTPELKPDTAQAEQTRIESILEIVGKSRELTAEIGTDYKRIIREYEVNRFDPRMTTGLRTKILDPIGLVQTNEFAQTESELNKFHASMKDGVAGLATQQAPPTVAAMQKLLEQLIAIRKNMGDTFGLNKIIVELKRLVDNQEKTAEEIERIRQDHYEKLLSIVVNAPVTLNVATGKTEKVTVKLQMPETLLKDPFLRFEIPVNSGLKITPSEVPLKDDSKDATFEVTAGMATGEFRVSIIPSQGKPKELKVVVK